MTHATTMLNRSAAQSPRSDACVPRAPSRTMVPVLQRRCACGGSASANGECEECRRKRERSLQRWPASTGAASGRDFSGVPNQGALSIVSKDDPSEREAEQIADAVMRSGAVSQPSRLGAGSKISLHRQPTPDDRPLINTGDLSKALNRPLPTRRAPAVRSCLTDDRCSQPIPGSSSEFAARVERAQQANATARHGGRRPPRQEAFPKATALSEFFSREAPNLLQGISGTLVNPDLANSGSGGQMGGCEHLRPRPEDANATCIEIPERLENQARDYNRGTVPEIGGLNRNEWRLNTLRIFTHEVAHHRFDQAKPAGVSMVEGVGEFELNELNAILSEMPIRYEMASARAAKPEEQPALFRQLVRERINSPNEGLRGILTKMRCLAPCAVVDQNVRVTFEALAAQWPPAVRQLVLSELNHPDHGLNWPVALPTPGLQKAAPSPGQRDSGMQLESAPLQRSADSNTALATTAPPIVHQVLSSSGETIETETRTLMEQRFGRDFSQVRIHRDARAGESARAVDALAYTVGSDIVLGPGQSMGRDPASRRLLAHELAHVVQQTDPAPLQRTSESEKATVSNQGPMAFVPNSTPDRKVRRLQRAWSWGRAALWGAIGGGFGALIGGVLGLGALVGLGVGALVGGLIGGFTGKRRSGNSVEVTEPTGPNDCRLQHHHKIFPSAQLALTWLGRAVDGLDRFLGAPGSRDARAVGAALDRHFHSREAPVVRHIRDRLNQVRTDISGRNPFTVECHGASDVQCQAFDAYVPAGNPNSLVFCPTFFSLPSNDDRAETIIHEMTHTLLGRPAIQDRAYRHERVVRHLTVEEALTNADSYGLFAQEIGQGTVMGDAVPPDSVTCPPAWRPMVDEAVARAQRINENAAVVVANSSPAVLNAWTDLQGQFLGGTTPAHLRPAQAAFQAVRTRMRRPISVVCHPGAEARCRPGTTLFVDGETLHVCPMWARLPAPQARLNLLLSRVYEAMGGVQTSFNAQRYAQLAIALTDRFYPVPTRAAILNPPAPAPAAAPLAAPAPPNAGQP
ncbi:MAG: DUF4157 domain-containing protein [Verrucomicrobiales bacterium]|nr:DUF4157 domain-containing protein [Verrucomicrobiales bacterium]